MESVGLVRRCISSRARRIWILVDSGTSGLERRRSKASESEAWSSSRTRVVPSFSMTTVRRRDPEEEEDPLAELEELEVPGEWN